MKTLARRARVLALRGILLLLTSWATAALAIPQAEFDALFARLTNANFGVREAAERALTTYATTAQLSGAQIRTLQTAGADLELRVRAERIFGAFVASQQSYKDIQLAIQTQQTLPRLVDPATGLTVVIGRFKFDDAKGQFRNQAADDNYRLLADAWLRIDTALRAGNVAEARKAMLALRAAVAALGVGAFGGNFIAPNDGGGRLGRNDILAKIDEALSALTQFQLDLFNGGAADDSALPVPTPVMNAGLLPLGQSAQLALSAVATPGSLLVLSTDANGAPALAPPGYMFVSPVFVLQAGDGLEVSGPVDIRFEYGSAALLGITHDLLDDLRIVRIADGQDFLLPTTFTSPDFVGGLYTPLSLGAGPDQFGEFAIVAPAPAPGTLLIIGIGLAGALPWLRRRNAPVATR